jgi:general secretion pathway protein G
MITTSGRRPTRDSGFSFVELLVVTALIGLLASAVMPLAHVAMQRTREVELRRTLRELRTAIDHYKDAADQGTIAATELKLGNEGYPPTLAVLVDGVRAAGDATDRKLKFLRRVPIDPITGTKEWGMRSYQDAADARTWGEQNVYDVFTTSDGTALDGTKYKDW